MQPHKVRYYLERRDEAFEQMMAEVLCVYREVAVLRASEGVQPNVAIISYDEQPGIQAIGNTAPDRPPQPGVHRGWARDHEYKRHGPSPSQNGGKAGGDELWSGFASNQGAALPPFCDGLHLRSNKFSAGVWDTYDEIVEACADAWNWFVNDPDRIRSIGQRDWATVNV